MSTSAQGGLTILHFWTTNYASLFGVTIDVTNGVTIEFRIPLNNCLVRSERGKAKPDLRLLDWDALHSTLEVNICVWRIFNSLGSRDAAEKWVRFHGFKISQYQQLKPNALVATYSVSGRGNLSTSGHRRALFPTRGYWKPYSHNLGVVWEPSVKAGQIPKIIKVRFSSNML